MIDIIVLPRAPGATEMTNKPWHSADKRLHASPREYADWQQIVQKRFRTVYAPELRRLAALIRETEDAGVPQREVSALYTGTMATLYSLAKTDPTVMED